MKYKVMCLEIVRTYRGVLSPGQVITLDESDLYYRLDHAFSLKSLDAQFYVCGALNKHFAIEPSR